MCDFNTFLLFVKFVQQVFKNGYLLKLLPNTDFVYTVSEGISKME